MASQKILDLLNALKLGTDQHRVHWEDLPDEDEFRTQLGGGLIRVGPLDEGHLSGYVLRLMGHTGAIAAEITFFPGQPGFELIEDLYSSARLRARGGEEIIDSIIQQLNPTAK